MLDINHVEVNLMFASAMIGITLVWGFCIKILYSVNWSCEIPQKEPLLGKRKNREKNYQHSNHSSL